MYKIEMEIIMKKIIGTELIIASDIKIFLFRFGIVTQKVMTV